MSTPAQPYGGEVEIQAKPTGKTVTTSVTRVPPPAGSTKTTTVTRVPPASDPQASRTGTRPSGSVKAQDTNFHGQIYGTSKWITPFTPGLVAEAEFGEKSCCPSCCPCLVCCDCVSEEIYRRTYARVYENRVEINTPFTYLAMCCCCTCSNKQCVTDYINVYYFDMPPTSAWSAPFPCCFMTNTCCGRPAVYLFTPTCCGCECCGGQTLLGSPCKIKCCLCCGDSCFPGSRPLLYPLKNGEKFLSAWRASYESYADKRGIPKEERARFWTTKKGCGGLASTEIGNDIWSTGQVMNLVEMQVMER